MVPSSHRNKIDVLSPFSGARVTSRNILPSRDPRTEQLVRADQAVWASFQSKLSHLSKIMASKIAQLNLSCE